MPTYDYACSSCGHEFSVQQKMSDAPVKECEKCGGAVSKVMVASNFMLKGGGWYADGYSAKKGGADKPCDAKSSSCGSCPAA